MIVARQATTGGSSLERVGADRSAVRRATLGATVDRLEPVLAVLDAYES